MVTDHMPALTALCEACPGATDVTLAVVLIFVFDAVHQCFFPFYSGVLIHREI